MKVFRLAGRLASAAVLLGMLAGCGRDAPPAPLVPVNGRIMFRGKPLSNITVTFVPEDDQGLDARATADADGRFTLATYPYGDGAMPGHYRVTVMYYSRNDGLPRPYTKWYQTPLTADVSEAGPNDFDFTVKE